MLESRRVVVRRCATWLLAGAAFTWSALASALGLGDINLHSALNQPLRAEIALVNADGLEEGEVSVSLATAQDFSRAGVEQVFFLNDLKFTPVLRGNRSLIQVTSHKPVNEPFLSFLVQLNQPNGRLLREYTVLIDPPGTPGIVLADDEPLVSRPSSALASVQSAASVPRESLPTPTAASPTDPLTEQLVASVLQNQQLQATIDELNAKLETQGEQITEEKKQITELQNRLVEATQAPTDPVAPVAVDPAPVAFEEPGTNWPLIVGLLTFLLLISLGLLFRRQRPQVQVSFEPSANELFRHEPLFSRTAETVTHTCVAQPTHAHPEQTPASDVLEVVAIHLTYGRYDDAIGLLQEAMVKEPQRTDLTVQLLEVLGKQVDIVGFEAQENSLRKTGFEAQKLKDIHARYPKLSLFAASAASSMAAMPEATPGDEFELNLDDLSMDASRDLTGPSEEPLSPGLSLSEPFAPEADIEWEIEPASHFMDPRFLDEFRDSGPSLEFELLKEPP